MDVISSPAYFSVHKSVDFNLTNTPVRFEVERLNVGGAMNLSSGIFTAPRAGKYFFSHSGLAYFPASSSRLYLDISLYVNGYKAVSGLADFNPRCICKREMKSSCRFGVCHQECTFMVVNLPILLAGW